MMNEIQEVGLVRPRRQLRNVGTFKCPACGRIMQSLKRLLNHMGLIHQHDPDFNVTCNIRNCSRSFVKFSSYYLLWKKVLKNTYHQHCSRTFEK